MTKNPKGVVIGLVVQEVQRLQVAVAGMRGELLELRRVVLTLSEAKNGRGHTPNTLERLDQIEAIVARQLGVSADAIRSTRRCQRVAWARHVFFTLAMEFTRLLPVDMAHLYQRERTTVLYGERMVREGCATDEQRRVEVEEIRGAIRTAIGPVPVSQTGQEVVSCR